MTMKSDARKTSTAPKENGCKKISRNNPPTVFLEDVETMPRSLTYFTKPSKSLVRGGFQHPQRPVFQLGSTRVNSAVIIHASGAPPLTNHQENSSGFVPSPKA